MPWGSPVTEFLGRCDEARAGDFTIRYLSRQDLIQMRQAIGRPKDLRRARELMRLCSDEPSGDAALRRAGRLLALR